MKPPHSSPLTGSLALEFLGSCGHTVFVPKSLLLYPNKKYSSHSQTMQIWADSAEFQDGGGGHGPQFQRIWELAAGSCHGWEMMGVEPTGHLIDVSDRDVVTGVEPTAIISNSLNSQNRRPHGSLCPMTPGKGHHQIQTFFTQN